MRDFCHDNKSPWERKPFARPIANSHRSFTKRLWLYGPQPFVLIKMNLSYPKEQLGNSPRLEIFCSSSPQMKFIWDSTQKTSLQLAIVVATVTCPFTVLLNIAVIGTIKKVRQLQTNSNILIESLAAAGLLVGAVCMPLTISLDTLILRGNASENIICTRVLVAMVVLYTAWSVSFYHLVIISWERYLAIAKRVEYKIIITKSRVNLLLLFQIPTL